MTPTVPSQWNGQAPGVDGVTVAAVATNAPQLSGSATLAVTARPSSTNQGSGLAGRLGVASGLTHSDESYSDIATGAHHKYLGRALEASGLAYWVRLLQNGLTDERLEAGFVGSEEYINNHSGVGSNWVHGLYVDVLGRAPAQAEMQYWLTNLAKGEAPADVAFGFAASQEHELLRVTVAYYHYLGRNPTQAEVPYWLNLYLGGADNEQVVANIVGSQEYFQNLGSNNVVDWLFAAYRATLQRQPDNAGYPYWLGKLQKAGDNVADWKLNCGYARVVTGAPAGSENNPVTTTRDFERADHDIL